MYFSWIKFRIVLGFICFLPYLAVSQWTQYTEVNSPLLDPNVNTVYAAPDSSIWVASQWSVVKIKNGHWTEIKELRSQHIRGFASDVNNKIWAVGIDTIIQETDKEWVKYPYNDKSFGVTCIAISKKNNIYIGTSTGLYQFLKGKLTNIPFGNGMTSINLTIHSLRFDKNETLWISCQSGLGKMSKNHQITWFDNIPGKNKIVYQSAEDELGNVWISMYPENYITLFKLKNNTWEIPENLPKVLEQKMYGQPNSITVHNVVLTKLGITFSTQFNGGIGWLGKAISPDENHQKLSKFWQGSIIPGSEQNGISTFIQDPFSNNIWVACWYSGLWKFNPYQKHSDTIAKFNHTVFPLAEQKHIECPSGIVKVSFQSNDSALVSVFMNETYIISKKSLKNKPHIQEIYSNSNKLHFYVISEQPKKIVITITNESQELGKFEWNCEPGKKYLLKL